MTIDLLNAEASLTRHLETSSEGSMCLIDWGESLPGCLLFRRELADDGVPGVGVRVDAWVWPARAYLIDRCGVLTTRLATAEEHLTTRSQ